MKKVLVVLFALIISISFCERGSVLLAQEEEASGDREEKFNPAGIFTGPIKENLRRYLNTDLDFFLGVLQGYDNNVNLDPNRDKAPFLQSTFSLDARRHVNENIRLTGIFDINDVKYYEYTDADLLDGFSELGFEIDSYKKIITLGSSYAFDYTWYPFDEESTYYTSKVSIFLKHNIIDNLYHKFTYSYLDKRYTKRKVYSAQNTLISDLRHDVRNTFQEEIGFYFLQSLIKLRGEIYINNSNDKYQDYYDYISYKIKTSLIHKFTKKLYTISSFAYQQRRYDDRVSTKTDTKVYEETFAVNASLMYDLTASFTLTFNYSYNENISNQPSQKYSNSMFTGGICYTF